MLVIFTSLEFRLIKSCCFAGSVIITFRLRAPFTRDDLVARQSSATDGKSLKAVETFTHSNERKKFALQPYEGCATVTGCSAKKVLYKNYY